MRETKTHQNKKYLAPKGSREESNNMLKIKVNEAKRQLEVSKSFYEKAKIFGSAEFKLLREAKREFPDYKVVTSTKKQSYKGLTEKTMEMFFESRIRTSEDKEIVKNDYDSYKNVVKLAETQKGKYPIIKKWFLDNFSEEYKEWSLTKEFNNPKAEENEANEIKEVA